MQPIAIILILMAGFIAGGVTLLGYMLYRMMRNDGWDDSNINNAERLLSHVVLHSEDFGQMYYLTEEHKVVLYEAFPFFEAGAKRPFWYVNKDEFQGVVKTRPPV